MSCFTLISGLDTSCEQYRKKYEQQIVLINKSDVDSYNIITSNEEECKHRILFNLKEGATGYRFTSIAQGTNIFGSFEKSVKEDIAQYKHNIQVLLMGVDENVKCLIKQLDNSEYFGAVQYKDGTVEVYGFDYGLKTDNYNYDPQNSGGGSLLILSSSGDALEDDPPFIYVSATPGNENEDFDNNFSDNEPVLLGDFNYDFNDDFYID